MVKPRVDILDRGDRRSVTVRRWGHFVYRRRIAVLALSLACFVLSIAGLLTGGQPINASNYDVESVRAANLESAQLPSTTGSSFTLILTSSQSDLWSARVRDGGQCSRRAAAQQLARERAGHTLHRRRRGGPADGLHRQAQRARAGGMKIDFSQARAQYEAIRGEVRSPSLEHHRDRRRAARLTISTRISRAICAGPRSCRCRSRSSCS